MRISVDKPRSSKTYFSVAGGLVAVGIVLMAAGFVLSGFNPAVFSTTVDARDRSFQLGGQEVENPEDLPLLGAFLGTFGSVDYGAEEAPAAPAAPNAPAAPTAAS